MRRRYQPQINHNSEFDLDLAPLLAVMVKLVPILLVSSAFVQLMVIESELPQTVLQAIADQNKNNTATSISAELTPKHEIKVTVRKNNSSEKTATINPDTDGHFNFAQAQLIFQKIKIENPEIFKLEISPSNEISYQEIIKVIDEVRRAKSRDSLFTFKDSKSGKDVTTDYMFPEVVFANTTGGD